jgi:flagellar biosynthetic protein FlhB
MAPLFGLMRNFIADSDRIEIGNFSAAYAVLADVTRALGMGFLPIFALLLFAAIAAPVMQIGWLFAPEKITPKFTIFNVAAGFQRLFNVSALVEFARGVTKVVIIAVVGYYILKPPVMRIELLVGLDPRLAFALMIALGEKLLFTIIAIIATIGVADFFYQRWQLNRQLRMTKQEVKDEHKNSEGDPLIKGTMRRIRFTRARRRMLQAVPKAAVVITNPTHYAVALHYELGSQGAPTVVAKGVDFMAKKIREIAVEHDVPIVENPPLTRALYASVELDDEIPAEHYKAVAEIIGYIMRLKRRPLPRAS